MSSPSVGNAPNVRWRIGKHRRDNRVELLEKLFSDNQVRF